MENTENKKYIDLCDTLIKQFETKLRDGNKIYICKKDSLAHNLVKDCHDTNEAGLVMPNDFIYEATLSLLASLSEYFAYEKNIDKVEDLLTEIADRQVPIYNNELSKLYADNTHLIDCYFQAASDQGLIGKDITIASGIGSAVCALVQELACKVFNFIKENA